MKRVPVDKYDKLKAGDILYIAPVGFKEQEDGTTKVAELPKERARLMRIYTREREIKDKKTGQWTGKFETVGDVVVYEELIDENNTKRPGYYYTVIGCGFFRVYSIETTVEDKADESTEL